MRIIKEGKTKELPKEVETECNHCGCVFAYEKEDLRHGIKMRPYCSNAIWVTCPFCGKSVDVEDIWR